MRTNSTGATRNGKQHKFEYQGFLSASVLHRFAEYMHKNRIQADGSVRDSDNWKKGMPQQWYSDSLFRHAIELQRAVERGDNGIIERNPDPKNPNMVVETYLSLEDALCAVIFNAQGWLYERLQASAPFSRPGSGSSALPTQSYTTSPDGSGKVGDAWPEFLVTTSGNSSGT